MLEKVKKKTKKTIKKSQKYPVYCLNNTMIFSISLNNKSNSELTKGTNYTKIIKKYIVTKKYASNNKNQELEKDANIMSS